MNYLLCIKKPECFSALGSVFLHHFRSKVRQLSEEGDHRRPDEIVGDRGNKCRESDHNDGDSGDTVDYAVVAFDREHLPGTELTVLELNSAGGNAEHRQRDHHGDGTDADKELQASGHTLVADPDGEHGERKQKGADEAVPGIQEEDQHQNRQNGNGGAHGDDTRAEEAGHDPAGNGEEQTSTGSDQTDPAQLGVILLQESEHTADSQSSNTDPHEHAQDAIPRQQGINGSGNVAAVDDEKIALCGKTGQKGIENIIKSSALLLLTLHALLAHGLFGHIVTTSV